MQTLNKLVTQEECSVDGSGSISNPLSNVISMINGQRPRTQIQTNAGPQYQNAEIADIECSFKQSMQFDRTNQWVSECQQQRPIQSGPRPGPSIRVSKIVGHIDHNDVRRGNRVNDVNKEEQESLSLHISKLKKLKFEKEKNLIMFDSSGETLLQKMKNACINNDLYTVRVLLQKAIDIRNIIGEVECYKCFENFIMKSFEYACESGNLSIVKEIAKEIIGRNDRNDTNECWDYGLKSACKGGHLALVKEMIKLGAELDFGIQVACENGHVDIVKELIQEIVKRGCEKTIDWNYGLLGACKSGHTDLVHEMIKHGAKNWNLGLSGACEGGHIVLVQEMIKLGANDWNSGLRNACKGNHIALAQEMIKRGANYWNDSLYCASEGGHFVLAQEMIKRGATNLNSFLSGACKSGNIMLVQEIIRHCDESGIKLDWDSGLFGACSGGHIVLVQEMIRRGATQFIYAMNVNTNVTINIIQELLKHTKSVTDGLIGAKFGGHLDIYLYLHIKKAVS